MCLNPHNVLLSVSLANCAVSDALFFLLYTAHHILASLEQKTDGYHCRGFYSSKLGIIMQPTPSFYLKIAYDKKSLTSSCRSRPSISCDIVAKLIGINETELANAGNRI